MDDAPAPVREFAEQAVAYVRRAVGVALEYDSDTLPLLDHYLHTVPADQADTLKLVIATAGAYFGEVVRRRLGGRWEAASPDNTQWRVVLPTGLNFSPTGFVASAIAQADLADLDSEIAAPPRMLPYVQQTLLARMGEGLDQRITIHFVDGLDTLEHVHEVLVAVAAQMIGPEDHVPDVSRRPGCP